MIDEEFKSHICTPIPRGSKKIYIDYYTITKDDMGRTLIQAKGLDGMLYELVKREQCELDKISLKFGHSDSDTW